MENTVSITALPFPPLPEIMHEERAALSGLYGQLADVRKELQQATADFLAANAEVKTQKDNMKVAYVHPTSGATWSMSIQKKIDQLKVDFVLKTPPIGGTEKERANERERMFWAECTEAVELKAKLDEAQDAKEAAEQERDQIEKRINALNRVIWSIQTECDGHEKIIGFLTVLQSSSSRVDAWQMVETRTEDIKAAIDEMSVALGTLLARVETLETTATKKNAAMAAIVAQLNA